MGVKITTFATHLNTVLNDAKEPLGLVSDYQEFRLPKVEDAAIGLEITYAQSTLEPLLQGEILLEDGGHGLLSKGHYVQMALKRIMPFFMQ